MATNVNVSQLLASLNRKEITAPDGAVYIAQAAIHKNAQTREQVKNGSCYLSIYAEKPLGTIQGIQVFLSETPSDSMQSNFVYLHNFMFDTSIHSSTSRRLYLERLALQAIREMYNPTISILCQTWFEYTGSTEGGKSLKKFAKVHKLETRDMWVIARAGTG